MHKNLMIFTILLVLIVGYGNATAGRQDIKPFRKDKTVSSGRQKINNSHIKSFDINAEKLSPNFKGTDIIKLFAELLKKAPLQKGEFETDESYEKKIIAAVPDNLYAFKLDPKIGSSFGGLTILPYDADRQEIAICVETVPLENTTFADHRASIVVKDIGGRSRSYVGTNAFGAKVVVDSYRSRQYGIALIDHQYFGAERGSYVKNDISESYREKCFEIDASTEKAKGLKKNIGVLLVCKPSLYTNLYGVTGKEGNDLFFRDSSYSRATFDDPNEAHYDRNFINVKVVAIWVYEINTGSVLLREQLHIEKESEENGESTK